MRMGNFLTVQRLLLIVMSAKRSSFGMHHVTVVPTNFTPRDSEDVSDDEGALSRDERVVSSDGDVPPRDE